MRQEIHSPPSPEYSNIITEMGICHSTSDLVNIQKPYRGNIVNISNFSIPENKLYTTVDVMRLIITPHYLDTENVTIVSISVTKSCTTHSQINRTNIWSTLNAGAQPCWSRNYFNWTHFQVYSQQIRRNKWCWYNTQESNWVCGYNTQWSWSTRNPNGWFFTWFFNST